MDETTPATKADINLLMDEMSKLYVANEQWKDEIVRHFDVVAENIHYDMVGAHKDKIGVIDDRSLQNRQRIEKIEAHLAI
jgi:hypothetical protein